MIYKALLAMVLLLPYRLHAEPLVLTPNTPRCDILRAAVGINERLPSECRPCVDVNTGCKGTPIEHQTAFSEKPRPLVIDNIQFENNSVKLGEIGRESLRNFAMAIQSTPDERYHLQGHANRTGAYDLNMRLSERRAAVVQHFLAGMGVASDHLVSEGFGYNRPTTNDPTDPVNRRVEIINSREIN